MLIEGGCLCAAVRYKSTVAPVVTRMCWCRLCQYIGAGSGTVNAAFRSETFTISGAMRDRRDVADSGNIMHRRFCAECGTALFSEAESRPHLIFVRAGTLDDPSIARPSAVIWTSQAPAWARFDPDLPQYEAQPPPVA